jgi:hypothetical protein
MKPRNWKVEYGPHRSSDGSQTSAIFFECDLGLRVEVSIVTQKLSGFGNANMPDDQKDRASRILRLMFEEYVTGNDIPVGQLTQINENDVDLKAVKTAASRGSTDRDEHKIMTRFTFVSLLLLDHTPGGFRATLQLSEIKIHGRMDGSKATQGGRDMKTCGLLGTLTLLILAWPCFGQELGEDVDNLILTEVSPTVSRLSWTGPKSVACETAVTYSVFRGTAEDFTPSSGNRIISGLTRMTYLAKEPVAKDYYYYVRAVVKPVSCDLHSGRVEVYPLDLGQTYSLTIGDEIGTCTAISTKELDCAVGPRRTFQVVIASQGTREYLLGCEFDDYETCVNLPAGVYTIVVHSRSVTVLHSGMEMINRKTGKRISGITPVFSILTRVPY